MFLQYSFTLLQRINMPIPTSQSLSSLIVVNAKLNDAIKTRMHKKNGAALKKSFEVVLLQYRCVWNLPRRIMNVVLRTAIVFALLDENVLQLVNMLDAAIQHYLTCCDTFIYYTTRDLPPDLVEPPPITITSPPGATKEELELLYNEERAKTQKLWREQTNSAYKNRECMEDALKQLLEYKMNHILNHEPKPSSPEFDFMNVLNAAGNISVTNEDDDDEQGDNFVNVDEVKKFVEACERLLSYL